MEEKNIKDYLHFYLGCECIDEDGRIGRFSGFDICVDDYSIVMITVKYSDDTEDWSVLNDNEDCDRIKLLLRRLSSMTEEEKTTVYKLLYGEDAYEAIRLNFALTLGNLNPEAFRYLLRNGFDLFDLIDSRLAVDKQTR